MSLGLINDNGLEVVLLFSFAPLVGALLPQTEYRRQCKMVVNLVENEFAPRMVILYPEPGAPSLEFYLYTSQFSL